MKQHMRFRLVLGRPAVMKIYAILLKYPIFEGGFFLSFHVQNQQKIRLCTKLINSEKIVNHCFLVYFFGSK